MSTNSGSVKPSDDKPLAIGVHAPLSILELPNELLHQIAVNSPCLEAFCHLGATNHCFHAIVNSQIIRDQFVEEWAGSRLSGTKGKIIAFIATIFHQTCIELLRFENDAAYPKKYARMVSRAHLQNPYCIGRFYSTQLSVPGWDVTRKYKMRTGKEKRRLQAIFMKLTNWICFKMTGCDSTWAIGSIPAKIPGKTPSSWLTKYYHLRLSRWGTPEFERCKIIDIMLLVEALLEHWPEDYSDMAMVGKIQVEVYDAWSSESDILAIGSLR
ncbi:hypothetical protein BJ508DRAFT_332991 [Ascobolus immersus RN42]|uniref:F-box domain-containing protein n=1 Tax=Ascobolus immersus RN42 TaxID=1160509 RepID=A0A3N4HR21_ASCIM|nr:hypothetical protein BJ508DRAFT_332991 [Ascobolus immersus RN42]